MTLNSNELITPESAAPSTYGSYDGGTNEIHSVGLVK